MSGLRNMVTEVTLEFFEIGNKNIIIRVEVGKRKVMWRRYKLVLDGKGVIMRWKVLGKNK